MKSSIDLKGKTVLITGAAGFIGARLIKNLLSTVFPVKLVGVDNICGYYDVSIKESRLHQIADIAAEHPESNWIFLKGSIADKSFVEGIFATYNPSIVINLAAQDSISYSLTNPDAYIDTNMLGFYNVLEACRHSYDNCRAGVQHLIYATSPVSDAAFSDKGASSLIELYATTKKSNELMANAYSRLYNIPTTGLRFFTVYGPEGRPDMAYFIFTNKLKDGDTIELYDFGNSQRDYTYVDDAVEGIKLVMQTEPVMTLDVAGKTVAPYAIYDLGSGQPVKMLDFLQVLQEELVSEGVLPKNFDFAAHQKLLPRREGEAASTFADTAAFKAKYGYVPNTDLHEGLHAFAEWYKNFYTKD